eukprot:3268786-Pyramimonas_sp.AAC.1
MVSDVIPSKVKPTAAEDWASLRFRDGCTWARYVLRLRSHRLGGRQVMLRSRCHLSGGRRRSSPHLGRAEHPSTCVGVLGRYLLLDSSLGCIMEAADAEATWDAANGVGSPPMGVG